MPGIPFCAVLTVRPWRADATIRLFLSVFVCIYGGSLVISTTHFLAAGTKQNYPGLALGLAGASIVLLALTLVGLLQRGAVITPAGKAIRLMLSFYAGMTSGAFAQRMMGPAGNSVAQILIGALSFQGMGLLLVVRYLKEHEISWDEAFGFSSHWHKAVVAGVISACLFLPVGWVLQQISVSILNHYPALGIQPEEQPAVQVLRIASSWKERTALGIVTIFLAPVAEEILFRGILYPWVKSYGFPRLALWGTALLFAAVHFNVLILLPLLLLAVLLTNLYERTGNLLASISAHSLFNALNFALLFVVERR